MDPFIVVEYELEEKCNYLKLCKLRINSPAFRCHSLLRPGIFAAVIARRGQRRLNSTVARAMGSLLAPCSGP